MARSTFVEAHQVEILGVRSARVQQFPWPFAFPLFLLSILLYSQAATVAAPVGVGRQPRIGPPLLIAMFPGGNRYFFLPTYATIVAAIQFDSMGMTLIGRWVLNHSLMRVGMVMTIVSVGTGLLLARLLYR